MAEENINALAAKHVGDIVRDAFEVSAESPALIVADHRSELSRILALAYKTALPTAAFLSFDETEPETVLAEIEKLPAKSLVVLVQSSSFRLNEFRLRVELFKRALKVIEHPHVGRMTEPHEVVTYIESLAYDKDYYRVIGPKLKEKIDKAKRIVVTSGDSELVYESDFQDAKLNIADYRAMKNWGGQFPIGEVFTEPKDFNGVNGEAKLFAFGDQNFMVNIPEKPVTIVIEKGIIVNVKDSTPIFEGILTQIKAEEEAWVRELGFGMNKAMRKDSIVKDIGTYERMCGIHLSLGAKHTIYAKEGFSRKHSRFHVDVFVDVTRVTIDGEVVFEGGKYVI